MDGKNNASVPVSSSKFCDLRSAILILTGLTATGKTSLALKLAAKYPIELISADARQVYTNMDIGTGKIGAGDTLEKIADQIWYLNNVPIHGINLISPNEIFSSMQFAAYAQQKIAEIQSRSSIPVIVGGTAFYLISLLNPAPEQHTPPNQILREKWQQQSTAMTREDYTISLQQELAQTNPDRLKIMNESDRNNPRRLMRAIEIALSVIPAKAGIHDRVISYPTMDSGLRRNYTATMISLHAPLDYLEFQIKTRVHQMLSLGLESEVTDLLQTYSWNDPGLQTIGYYEWQPFFEGKIDREEVVNQIILHNRQYARKQQIYLKRYPNIQRFDISDPTQLDQCSQKCEEILNKT